MILESVWYAGPDEQFAPDAFPVNRLVTVTAGGRAWLGSILSAEVKPGGKEIHLTVEVEDPPPAEAEVGTRG